MDLPSEFVRGETASLEEDREHEFKLCGETENIVSRITNLAKEYVNAFLNSDGGTLYCGISDDGVVEGILLDRKTKDLVRCGVDSVVDLMSPQVDPDLFKVVFVPVVDKKANMLYTSVRPRSNSLSKGKKVPVRRIAKSRKEGGSSLPLPGSEFSLKVDQIADMELYVVAVCVQRGRAPVYFTTRMGDVAFVRFDGSVRRMTKDIIQERKSLGRMSRSHVYTRARCSEIIGREEELSVIRSFITERLEYQQLFDDRAGLCFDEEFVLAPCHIVIIIHGQPLVGKKSVAKMVAAEFSKTFRNGFFSLSLKGGHSRAPSYSKTPPPFPTSPESAHRREKEKIDDAMMGVIRQVHPTAPQPQGDMERRGLYESCFKGKDTILLLENVDSGDQITSLLPDTCKSCLVIATSRKAITFEFDVENCLSLRLSALSPRDAVRLLESYAPYAFQNRCDDKPGKHAWKENLVNADRLCRLCGYMPMAIRLIASKLNRDPSTSVAQIIEQLESNPAQLTSLLEPFIVLTDADWHALAVSVFPDAFDGAAASSVFGEEYDVTQRCLSQLLNQSLLEFDATTGKYFQNDAVRAFCCAKARETMAEQQCEWKQSYAAHYANKVRFLGEQSDAECVARVLLEEEKSILAAIEYASELQLNEMFTGMVDTLAGLLKEIRMDREQSRAWHAQISLFQSQLT